MLDQTKATELVRLFQEFLPYASTDEGQTHLASYEPQRAQGRQNYERILQRQQQGEDVTDDVLLGLLPYADTANNRASGAWVHIAPAINGNLRAWFENAGWTNPTDWPKIADAILDLLVHAEEFGRIHKHCDAFGALPYTKGFQTGMISPILNALWPERYYLVNNKVRDVVCYFCGLRLSQSLTDYAALSQEVHELVTIVVPTIPGVSELSASHADLLDMFCHWMRAVRKYPYGRGKESEQAERPIKTVAEEPATYVPPLAEPFATIFRDWDEANWLMDLAQELLMALEIVGGLGERVVITMPNNRVLKVILGERSILEFGSRQTMSLALLAEDADQLEGILERKELVAWADSMVPVVRCVFSRENNLADNTVLREAFRRSFGAHTEYLTHWPGSKYAYLHKPQVAKAILAPDYRRQLLAKGLPELEPPPILAEPFATIFHDWENAEGAFELIRDTVVQLGIKRWDDPALAVTLRQYTSRQRALCINYYSWRVIEFHNTDENSPWIELALLLEPAKAWVPGLTASFNKPVSEELVTLVDFEFVHDPDGKGPKDDAGLAEILELQQKTLPVIKQAFKNWNSSPFLRFHQPEIAQAVFDVEMRRRVLSEGVTEVTSDEIEDPPITTDHYFTERTFELLEQLDQTPTLATYNADKAAFEEHLIVPFQQLMHDVAAELPPAITDVMETEKRIFARIPKNDYGRGGAWAHYWGAFYPRGGSRMNDAQLLLGINKDRLEIAFYFGEHGNEHRERLLAHVPLLMERLDDLDQRLIEGGFAIDLDDASVEIPLSVPLDEVLTAGPDEEVRAAVSVPSHQLLACPRESLKPLVLDVFTAYFPLVLAAIRDDAEPAIRKYLGITEPPKPLNPEHSLAAIADVTSFPLYDLQDWVRAIERKGQAILYGPPGTGKTFVAEKLAAHLIGGGDGFTWLVQFHPAYAYEDFIEGIRPASDAEGGLTYPVKPGLFRRFCAKAAKCEGRCVLIIDEINRANLARVFGELMYLLEYRAEEVDLAVSGDQFAIPPNVRIIGTMNTADRSIALVDHALRRRFAFIALQPQYDVLRAKIDGSAGVNVAGLVGVLERINERIGDPNYAVGISFFLGADLATNLPSIWRMEIEPYLAEYFWGQNDQAGAFRWEKIESQVLD